MDARHKIEIEKAAAVALLREIAETIDGDEQAKIDMIEGETRLFDALAAAVDRIAEAAAHAEAVDIMIRSMQDRKSRFDTIVERLRNSIRSAMETTAILKMELPRATISLRYVPPKVEITNPMEIPDDYLKQPPPVVDKAAIKKALGDGIDVPGARMSNGSQTIAIKFG